jgi:competence protein ComEC
MAIIGGLFATLFSRLLGPRKGALAAVAGIAIYTVLVGANPAVVRSAMMSGSAIFARQVGRRQDGLNTLLLVGAVMALFHPFVLWEIGFQLSFMATLGLVLYAGPLGEWFTNLLAKRMPADSARRLARPVGEYVLFTFAAQLTTLPVLAYHFERVSFIALVANPFILPAQPMVMILGGAATMAGLVWLPLGKLAAWFAWPFVVYTVRVVEWFAQVESSEIMLGEVALAVVLLFYGFIFGLTFLKPRFPQVFAAIRPGFFLSVLGVVTVFIWRAGVSAPDGNLHVTIIDVSAGSTSGEAVLVQTPSGRYVLINGGPNASLLSDSLGRRLPLAQRSLDWLVVANPADEHIAALPRVVERFPAGQVLWAGDTYTSRSARALQPVFSREGVEVVPARAGQILDMGGGCRLRVLASYRSGAMLLLEWREFRMLIPSGASLMDLETVVDPGLLRPLSALMLADGGYEPANPADVIRSLEPGLVIISVAPADNKGRPSVDGLEGYTVLRTDRNGWVRITTDGEVMWVEAAR